ncbi:MAG: hypothetical protein ABWK15_01815 [Dissulfuribacterales bacterium]
MLTVVVVCHDAGGAEVLSAMIAANTYRCKWHVIGKDASPAQIVFERKGLKRFWITLKDIDSVSGIMAAISPDYLFYSTGWQIRIEDGFLQWAKKNSVTTVAFLEHWVNYRERFGYPNKGWQRNLPDWIAVGDEIALKLATELELPHLLYVKNYYFDEMRQKAATFSSRCQVSTSDLCVFVSEPISEGAQKLYGDAAYWGFSELATIESILNQFTLIEKHFGVKRLLIRLHPSENALNYSELLLKYPELLTIHSAHESSLIEDIASARLVIGFTSMALFNAYLMGKPVISFIPSKKLKCAVPIPSSCQVTDMNGLLGVNLRCEDNAAFDTRFLGGVKLDELLTFLEEQRRENSCHN